MKRFMSMITKGNLSEYMTQDLINTKFKNELVLEENNFHILEQRTDKVALAQTIQNLIIFHKGNYPNQPQLGIGIEDYLFELLTGDLTTTLEMEIDGQIKAFIPTEYNVNFEVINQKINGLVALAINFSIEDKYAETVTEFGLVFGRNQKSKKLVSKLVI